jgi:hypothetical protein
MWEDPIVDEVRKVRDAHAAHLNYDLNKIYSALKEAEANSRRQFIKLSPKMIGPKEKHSAEMET